MTKEDALKIIKLLSALESWSFSTKTDLPDYLHEDLCLAVERLEKIVLEKHMTEEDEEFIRIEREAAMRNAAAAPPAPVQQILAAFPLLDDGGLDQEEHHCEWTLQQDRKRLHAMLAAAPQPAPVQEPVAWMHEWEDGERIPTLHTRDSRKNDKPKSVRPLVYGDTSPQPAQRTWVGLTWQDWNGVAYTSDFRRGAEWADAQLREKNT